MPFYADLHVHSKYARATSGDLDLEHMALWAAKKGVAVLGTGDFTHPAWFREIQEKLVPAEPGLFRLKPDLERWCAAQFPAFAQQPTRFLLEVEVSTIYKKGDKTRKVHHLHYVPDLAGAERFIARLARIGNLNADGRPILGLDSRDLLEITLAAGEGAFLIPAHIWTPWFAALGSKSGFDSIADCYGDLTPEIFALETGLSSDPPMNWRLSQLDRFRLVSNSDAHSPGKIGREACQFDCPLDYWSLREALRTGCGYGGTVEFFPEEGKYHLDGHRACGVRCAPEETKKHGGLCPACGKELTVGVMHRVDELADRANAAKPDGAAGFRSLVPLPELLAEIHRVGAASRKVADGYEKLLGAFGSELFILERAPLDELRRTGSTLLAEGVARMREGRVHRQAGYDGEYGVIRVFTDEELERSGGVSLLFDVPKSREAPSPVFEFAGGDAIRSPAKAEERLPQTSLSAHEAEAAPARLEERFAGPPDSPATAADPLAGLDPEQRAAAECTRGALVVIAGPGTGKTRTLTQRLAHLVQREGVPPGQILAVTFTNRAAHEMRERLSQLLPGGTAAGSGAEAPLVTTFHGFGHRLLREHGQRAGLDADFRVASEAERRALLAARLNCSAHKAALWLKRLSLAKRQGAEPPGRNLAASVPTEEQFALATYNQALRERRWVDFDDLIALPVHLLEEHPDVRDACRRRWRFVSVDEFQDIDALQYRLVRSLVPADGNLCVIGDPDQAIYGFRGAEPRFFTRLAQDFPGARTVQLRRNYRSGRAIVQGALQAIAPDTLVEGRVLEAMAADATRISVHETPTDKAEAEFVVHTLEQLIGGHAFFSLDSGRVAAGATAGELSFSDFAVLYRSEAQADALSEAFARSGIPCQRHSHEPLAERDAVRALLEAMRALPAGQSVRERWRVAGDLLQREADVVAFAAALEPLAARCAHDLARFESELALMSDADLWDPRADRVSLLTLHASKGLEFPVVFLTGCEDGLLPLRFGPGDDADLAEERRLFFVGMTRARERLFLTHAQRRRWRGQLRAQAVSPFVAAIKEELLARSKADLKPREKPAAEQLALFG